MKSRTWIDFLAEQIFNAIIHNPIERKNRSMIIKKTVMLLKRLRNIFIPVCNPVFPAASVILILLIFACCVNALPENESGHNFIDEARFIFVTAACGRDDSVRRKDDPIIDEHCRIMNRYIERYKSEFADKAGPFISRLKPGKLPEKIIYPFGGTDLLAAIVTYPEGSEYITISLESAGDPRRLSKASRSDIIKALGEYRSSIGYILNTNDSSNNNVKNLETGIMPNQLAFSMAALTVFGYEPLSLKYFRVNPDGTLHYYSLKEISGLENVKAQRLAPWCASPDFSVAFRNMELKFRKYGGGKTITYRHFAANLADSSMAGTPLMKHLESMGRVSAMTKAASYLMWRDDFSVIRNYLLRNMDFMVADSTGILPRHAEAAGFEAATFGRFNGAFLDKNGGSDAAYLRKYWESHEYRPMDFRYGYSDVRGASHMIIYRMKKN
jgi:hypothetical protein